MNPFQTAFLPVLNQRFATSMAQFLVIEAIAVEIGHFVFAFKFDSESSIGFKVVLLFSFLPAFIVWKNLLSEFSKKSCFSQNMTIKSGMQMIATIFVFGFLLLKSFNFNSMENILIYTEGPFSPPVIKEAYFISIINLFIIAFIATADFIILERFRLRFQPFDLKTALRRCGIKTLFCVSSFMLFVIFLKDLAYKLIQMGLFVFFGTNSSRIGRVGFVEMFSVLFISLVVAFICNFLIEAMCAILNENISSNSEILSITLEELLEGLKDEHRLFNYHAWAQLELISQSKCKLRIQLFEDIEQSPTAIEKIVFHFTNSFSGWNKEIEAFIENQKLLKSSKGTDQAEILKSTVVFDSEMPSFLKLSAPQVVPKPVEPLNIMTLINQSALGQIFSNSREQHRLEKLFNLKHFYCQRIHVLINLLNAAYMEDKYGQIHIKTPMILKVSKATLELLSKIDSHEAFIMASELRKLVDELK